MLKINILGTEYQILYQSPAENSKLEDANGLCEFWSKRIIIDKTEPDRLTFENIDAFDRKVLRHEIIHAFLGESGLKDYMNDETLVDWLAVQFPKIADVFDQLGIGI